MGDEIRKIVKGEVKYSGNLKKIKTTMSKGGLIGDDISNQ